MLTQSAEVEDDPTNGSKTVYMWSTGPGRLCATLAEDAKPSAVISHSGRNTLM